MRAAQLLGLSSVDLLVRRQCSLPKLTGRSDVATALLQVAATMVEACLFVDVGNSLPQRLPLVETLAGLLEFANIDQAGRHSSEHGRLAVAVMVGVVHLSRLVIAEHGLGGVTHAAMDVAEHVQRLRLVPPVTCLAKGDHGVAQVSQGSGMVAGGLVGLAQGIECD